MWTLIGMIAVTVGTYLVGGDGDGNEQGGVASSDESEKEWYENPLVIMGFVFIGLLVIITIIAIAFKD